MVFFSSRQSDDLKTEIEKCQIRYDQLQFILQRQFMLIDIYPLPFKMREFEVN